MKCEVCQFSFQLLFENVTTLSVFNEKQKNQISTKQYDNNVSCTMICLNLQQMNISTK
jgi:hypothetical protein